MSWPVDEAKAHFDELLEATVTTGAQIITVSGVETAVLVPIAEWRRLQQRVRPTLKELLLCDFARADLNIPPRGNRRRRRPFSFVGKG